MAIANPENYLTQASADARYQAVGSLGSATPAQVDAGDTGTAGVSSSAARQDHEHPVGITSAQLVPAAWLAAWTSWSPTWTNLTVGNGTLTARYVQMGKTIHFYLKLVLGSTSSIGGSVDFTLPAAPSVGTANVDHPFNVTILDSGTAQFGGATVFSSGSTVTLKVESVGGTYNTLTNFSSTVPMTWTTGDAFVVTGTYEAA